MAGQALFARQMHIFSAPIDAQPLPLTNSERTRMLCRGNFLHNLLVKYARSLGASGYDKGHPPFQDYVAGYLWDAAHGEGYADVPAYARAEVEELKRRFPPRRLDGFGPCAYWAKPKSSSRCRRAA